MSTDALEQALTFAQKCLQCAPVLVVGSGLSMPHGLPSMRDLGDTLLVKLDALGLTGTDAASLHQLRTELAYHDLETALTRCTVSDALTARIVRITWDVVQACDASVFQQVLSDRAALPLSRLLTHLFESTQTRISVVTTNYDRLIEYSAAAASIHHTTGFTFGYLGERPSIPQDVCQRPKNVRVRTVEIWKVHGSLDWYERTNQAVLSSPIVPDGAFAPVIVTPGVNKYQRALEEPFRSVLSGADVALSQASGYLTVGFGFNDAHIQPKLVDRCKHSSVPLVVLARTLTPKAKELLLGGTCRNFMAFEKHVDGTQVYSSTNLAGEVLVGADLWSLDSLLELAI